MADILVNKSLQTMAAFLEEFRHLLPDEYHAMFYVKRSDETMFPFRGHAFSNTGQMRVKALLDGDRFGWVMVKDDDQIYFTTNVINMTAFKTTVTELSGLYNIALISQPPNIHYATT